MMLSGSGGSRKYALKHQHGSESTEDLQCICQKKSTVRSNGLNAIRDNKQKNRCDKGMPTGVQG